MIDVKHTKTYLEPYDLYEYSSKKGLVKVLGSLKYILSLVLFIAVRYLAYLRIAGLISLEFGGLAVLLAVVVFSIGLVYILVGRG